MFVNRLRVGMPLQTDPTVIYGLGAAFDGNLRKRDLQADTPYNTYTRAGLPPTPIAMPGKPSLLAAVRPEATKALYFVVARRRQQPVQRNPRRAQSRGQSLPAQDSRSRCPAASSPSKASTAPASRPTSRPSPSACVRGGNEVVCTREPGGTELAEQLRDLVLHTPMDALTEALLVFAARRDHLAARDRARAGARRTVLCDRFTDATFAYQGGGRGFDRDVLAQLETWVQEGLQPDLTLWFDLDPDDRARRAPAGRARADRFEAEDLDFFERVRAGYAGAHAGRIRSASCASTPLRIAGAVRPQIDRRAGGARMVGRRRRAAAAVARRAAARSARGASVRTRCCCTVRRASASSSWR